MNEWETRIKQYDLLHKQSLEILVYLATPIVFPHENIHLDSLLTEVVARELFGHDIDRWQNQDKHVPIPLPLEKTKGKYPIWKASVAFCSSKAREHQDFWVKRTNDEFSGYSSQKIVWPAGVIGDTVAKQLAYEVHLEKPTGPANNPASGGFKSYFEPRNLLATEYLIFHAKGNKTEIHRLLSKIKGIGKKTAIGFGKVKKVVVTEIEKDYSFFTPDLKPARVLPVEDFPKVKARMIASRVTAPYWSKRNMVVCYAPVSPLPKWQWDVYSQHKPTFEEIWFEENVDEDWFDE